MFVMTCLLERRLFNLPILMIHTMTFPIRHSTACLPYGCLVTRLLRALTVDSGTEAAMAILRDYGFYTIETFPHMGLTAY
ncbi:hypothetical protein P3X46_004665 [Hevea brasiliensis]|uniref:Uncharacterized protein n=1 Tax=Hevea brasiliensis TaxID=3981 RepID=A0ABQ9MYC6_HEVBR|nr:hypothetical protein P3X46_004665 [Hevea brasiliensis]